jgi:hypothetical protein
MWLSGLRGAVAFALAFDSPNHRDPFITTTLVVVFITTIVFGGLTYPVLKKFDLTRTGAPEQSMKADDVTKHWFVSIDRRFIIPFFRSSLFWSERAQSRKYGSGAHEHGHSDDASSDGQSDAGNGPASFPTVSQASQPEADLRTADDLELELDEAHLRALENASPILQVPDPSSADDMEAAAGDVAAEDDPEYDLRDASLRLSQPYQSTF